MWKQTKFKVISLLILLASGTGLQAQYLFLLKSDSTGKWFKTKNYGVEIYGHGFQESNTITTGFVNDFIGGGYLDEEKKNNIRNNLNAENNRIGVGLNYGINFIIAPDSLFGSDKIGVRVGVSDYQDYSAKFGQDYFNLAFYGNKPFEGTTANLSNSGLFMHRYQKISFGVFDKSSLSGLSVSMVNGEQFFEFRTDNAGLYTESGGEFIEFTADGYTWQSDTANVGFMKSNGLGAVIDFNLNFPVFCKKNPDRPSFIRFQANDIGFIQWNNGSMNYQFDSTIVYDGFYVDNLFDPGNLSFDSAGLIDSLVPNNNKEPHYLPTPARFSLSWFSHIGKSFHYELQVRARLNAFYLPQGTARLFYRAHENLLFGVNASYGGFGGFQGGIHASATLGHSFLVQLETQCLSGLFSSKSNNRNLFVNLMYLF
jgi:hypothetical protein